MIMVSFVRVPTTQASLRAVHRSPIATKSAELANSQNSKV